MAPPPEGDEVAAPRPNSGQWRRGSRKARTCPRRRPRPQLVGSSVAFPLFFGVGCGRKVGRTTVAADCKATAVWCLVEARVRHRWFRNNVEAAEEVRSAAKRNASRSCLKSRKTISTSRKEGKKERKKEKPERKPKKADEKMDRIAATSAVVSAVVFANTWHAQFVYDDRWVQFFLSSFSFSHRFNRVSSMFSSVYCWFHFLLVLLKNENRTLPSFFTGFPGVRMDHF